MTENSGDKVRRIEELVNQMRANADEMEKSRRVIELLEEFAKEMKKRLPPTSEEEKKAAPVWPIYMQEALLDSVAQCKLDFKVAKRDISDAMRIAVKTYPNMRTDRNNEHIFASLNIDQFNYFSVFIFEYYMRCISRWRDECRDWRDYLAMERLWSECFASLEKAGCDMVRYLRVDDARVVIAQAIRHESGRRELMQWTNELDTALSDFIFNTVKQHEQGIKISMKRLEEYDRASAIEKLLQEVEWICLHERVWIKGRVNIGSAGYICSQNSSGDCTYSVGGAWFANKLKFTRKRNHDLIVHKHNSGGWEHSVHRTYDNICHEGFWELAIYLDIVYALKCGWIVPLDKWF